MSLQNSNIKLIILVSALALSGLILTQLFWVMKAIHLSEKQYNHRVDMALEDVLTDMLGSSKTLYLSDQKDPAGQKSLHKTVFLMQWTL